MVYHLVLEGSSTHGRFQNFKFQQFFGAIFACFLHIPLLSGGKEPRSRFFAGQLTGASLASDAAGLNQGVSYIAGKIAPSMGGIAALWLSGQYLSVPASVGFIALLGIAVLNALVLVMHFNHLHALGLPMEQVVREGSLRRLRPVLMTACITALGLVPLLLASGPGSEIQRPLAIVVIGGLVSSTALTLLLLPVLYRRFGQPRGAAASPALDSPAPERSAP